MFKERFMPMFESDGGAGGAGGEDNPPKDDKKDNPKSFDDLLAENKEYQAEFDRRMSKGIKTAIENEHKRIDEIVDEKLSEAERLAKMTDLEKKKYEQDKQAKEIARREAEITRRELQAEAKNTLAEKKLPQELAEILNYKDADACNSSITTVEKAWRDAVNAGVDERLKGGKPPKDVKHKENANAELEKEIRDAMARRVF